MNCGGGERVIRFANFVPIVAADFLWATVIHFFSGVDGILIRFFALDFIARLRSREMY